MTPVASAEEEDAEDAEDTEAAGTEYHFFPAESELSKEKYRQQQEQQLAVSGDTETQVEEAGDGDTSDLSQHLNSALNLATVTWTQVGQYL